MPRNTLIPDPVWRQLRIFAVDPAVSAQFDTADIGEAKISVPWEELDLGPTGEYLEVVDIDPAGGSAYKPVDLNDDRILAQDGLPPSEANPQFHQQMVYAVAMSTIWHFERALGRVALWSSHRFRHNGGQYREQFVRKLRIYPHALRDRNAYYSPEKKALLFGYFPVGIRDAHNTPGTIVFTCLSHDIIAHETTHALLDGVHPRFNEPMNPDVLAFHEAFADIVALFQHFSYPGLLRDQIGRTRGDLRNESMLGQLAQQFGRASGRGEALRDALGSVNPQTGRWEQRPPDVHALDKTFEPHARGAILVAAVFGAFLKVYRSRTLDLYRIATDGTGVLREGDIHPDLARRLASEAADCARLTLQMCIRAIDYCPPVGITFGDYLRAIVTAETDVDPEDRLNFRLAFTESFRQWGISPFGLRGMSVESFLWPTGEAVLMEQQALAGSSSDALLEGLGVSGRAWDQSQESADLKALFQNAQRVETEELHFGAESDSEQNRRLVPPTWSGDRLAHWQGMKQNAAVVHAWLMHGEGRKMAAAIGLVLDDAPPTVHRSKQTNTPAVEVHSVRYALRRGPRGEPFNDLVVEITQRRRGYLDRNLQEMSDRPGNAESLPKQDFWYRAGCTLLIDQKDMQVRRVIRTRGDINNNDELERMRKYLAKELEPANAFAHGYETLHASEPFALLHRELES